jgi:flagellum-specific ATP synthase
LARYFKAVHSKYEKGRDLIQIGAYASGSDTALDEAIALRDSMQTFLQQDMYESASFDASVADMAQALGQQRGSTTTDPGLMADAQIQ